VASPAALKPPVIFLNAFTKKAAENLNPPQHMTGVGDQEDDTNIVRKSHEVVLEERPIIIRS